MLRLLLGPVAIVIAANHLPSIVFAPLLVVGLLSDYFDGVIARRLNVASPWLRRFDSITDLVFYLCILVSSWIVARHVMGQSLIPLCLLLGSEAVCILISTARFGVFPATHCYSAKIYGLAMFSAFLGVLAFDSGPWIFAVLTVFGLIANAEVIAILLLSPRAPVDVLSIFHLRHSLMTSHAPVSPTVHQQSTDRRVMLGTFR